MTTFSTFTLEATDVAHAIASLAEVDRDPLEARIAQAAMAFVTGHPEDAYRELRQVRYAAERIEFERGRTGNWPVDVPGGCVSGV